tara:strand:+ start:365 stop:1468 length:1104 start_codon:yes stop_codon:yes gene_type:complete
MPAINANIVVDQTNLTLTPTTNTIGVTVDPISLNVYPAPPQLPPQGSTGELQYITAGNSFGGLANSNVSSGTLTFENLANLKINGGINGYVLQTDGTGTLAWTAQTGGGGSGNPGGADSQIQYNDNGVFGGIAGFTLNDVSGIVSMPTDLNVVSDITTTSGAFFGDGYGLSNIVGANISGAVAFATTANAVAGANVIGPVATSTTAGTVTTAAQPNITSTGTLTSLTVNALNVDGTTTIQQAIEKVTNDVTGSTGVIDYNLLDQAILYKSVNAIANFNLNIKGNASTTLNSVMSNDQSMTLTFLNQNGATPYYLQSFLIDGVSQTVNYAGGVNPSAGTPNSIDSYTFNIMKTASSTYTILGTTGTYS